MLQSSDYVVCLLEKKERAIKRDRQKNRQSQKYAGGALVNLPSDCDPPINKRARVCRENNQQVLMKNTIEASATTFRLIAMKVPENEVVTNTLAMPSPAYALPVTAAPIAQQVGPIHGGASVESMVNAVATDTLATLQPSASYDFSECISMPPLVEDKPAETVDEEGGCTSGEQEIRILPVEKSHWEYQPSIADPESLAEDAISDSIFLLSRTVYGFAEDFIHPFLNENEVADN